MIRKPLIAGIWALAVVAVAAPITQAQTTYTWTGGGNPDPNWSNPSNWGGTLPLDDETNTLIALAGTTNLNTVLDLLSGSGGGSFNINGLSYAANAGAFAINPTGSNITTLRIGSGGMTISNANLQTIAAPVVLSANQTWNLAGTPPVTWTNPQSTQQIMSFRASRLIATGNLDLGGNTLTVNVNTPTNFPTPNPYVPFDMAYAGTTLQINNQPPGEARITGTVSNGGITKTGPGVLTLAGPSTPTGPIGVNGGALAIDRSAVGAAPFGAGPVGLGGGVLSFRRVAAPVAINAAGFNHDVITSVGDSNAGNPFGTTTAVDALPAPGQPGFVLYEVGSTVNPGFQPSGLPSSRSIVGAHNTLATYQLQPYQGAGAGNINNNVLQLNNTTGNTGTLALTTPAPFATLSLLVMGGSGASNFTAQLNFATGDPVTFNLQAPDWFNQAPFAISGLGRMEREDGIFDNQVNNPRMYPVDIHLSADDQARNLTSILFTRTSTGAGNILNVFAISGYAPDAAAPTSYSNPINVTANSTIEMWGTPALTLGPLSIGGQTLTTAAGGTTTLTFPSTSATGNPTFNIATSQTFRPGPIDFNSAARTVTKAGNGLMILDQPAANATAINRLTVNAGTATVSNITAMGNTPNLTVGGGTANTGPYTTLNSVTTTAGTGNLANVTSVLTTLTTSGGTTNFPQNVAIPTTTMSGGTVNFNAGAALTEATIGAGTANFGASSSAGRFNGGVTATVNLNNSSVLTVGSGNQADNYGGFLNGNGSLVKTGSGTQTLSRPFSNYSGGTTVSGGQLTAEQPGSLGTGAVTLQNNTVLSIGGVPGSTILGFGGNGTGWTLNGGPTVASDVLTLTTNANNLNRSAFFNTKQPTTAFTASFDYIRGPEGSGNPADGATFAIQNQAVTALGAAGGGLGYAGLNPARGIAINIYNPNGRGISVRVDGTVPGGGGYTAVAPVDIFNSGSNPVRFNLIYDGNNLNVSLIQGTNTFNLPPVAWNLGGLGGDAWVGFTGATGGENSSQRIANFTYNLTGGATPPPVSTYTNAVNIPDGASAEIRPKVAAGGVTTFAMGNLSMGSGTTLTVQPEAGSLADTAYNLTLGATTLSGPATFSVANNGSGAGSLTLGSLNDGGTARTINKDGPGSLLLPAAATSLVDGTTVNVNQGTLRVNQPAALGSVAAVAVAPTAALSLGANQTVGALNGAGSVVLDGNTLTVGSTNNLSSAFDGVIADGAAVGGLTKAGTGMMVLSNANTYTGPTAVNAGTLRVTNTSGSGTGTGLVDINASGTLDGSGTIAGAVNLNDGGAIQGGTGGSATATNTLSLPAGLQFDGANSVLVVVGDAIQGNGLADAVASRLDLGASVLSRNTDGAGSDLTTIRLSAVPNSLDAFVPYTVTIATYGSFSNLALTDFSIDPNPTGFDFLGSPSLTLNGTELLLTFTPTPEPGAILGVAGLVGLGAVGLRRRLGRNRAGTAEVLAA